MFRSLHTHHLQRARTFNVLNLLLELFTLSSTISFFYHLELLIYTNAIGNTLLSTFIKWDVNWGINWIQLMQGLRSCQQTGRVSRSLEFLAARNDPKHFDYRGDTKGCELVRRGNPSHYPR